MPLPPVPPAPATKQPAQPEATPPPAPYLARPADGGLPIDPVPNSGYSGGDSQWDQLNYIDDSPISDEPSRCIGDCRDSDFTPFVLTSQGVCILNRGRARGSALSTDLLSDGKRHGVFSGRSLAFQVAPGYDEIVEGYLGRDANNCDWSIQGGFRGFNDWVTTGWVDAGYTITEATSAGTITHGSLNSFFAGQFIGLDWVDHQAARYNTGFDTAEINVVLRPHPRSDRLVLYPNGRWYRQPETGTYWSVLAGVRYLRIDEGFTFQGSGAYTQNQGGVITQGTVSGRYFAHTRNPMIGLQLGTEVGFRERGWELGLHFKASPLINSALAESRVNTTDPIFGDQAASYRFVATNVAAYLELGFLGIYRLNEAWAVRGGYDISWLSGVALAPVQRPMANDLDATSTLFLQGLTLAVEYRR